MNPPDLELGKPRERVLITGATGFVGRRLATTLRADGVAVRALVRPGTDPATLEAVGVEIARGDVTDADAVAAACDGCDAVVHAAAATARTPGGVAVNAESPARVWRAAARAGVARFVHVSTAGVHGPLRRWPIDEDGPLRPDTRYRRGKLRGERVLRAAAREHDGPHAGPEVVIARPTSIAGPGSGGAWAGLCRSLTRGRPWVVGGGLQPMHLTDVDDVCRGLIACLVRPAAAGGTFFLAAERALPLDALMALFAAELGVPYRPRRLPAFPTAALTHLSLAAAAPLGREPRALHSLSFLTAARAYDPGRAAAVLGFTARHAPRETVQRTVDGLTP